MLHIFGAKIFVLSALNYVETLKTSSSKEGQAALDTEDSNAVKILTIHMSKGLQFKNVIIPDVHLKCQKSNNQLFDREDSAGIITSLKELNNKNKEEEKNPLYIRFSEQKKNKELEEAKRILYVAMTRAEQNLYLIGEEQEVKDENDLNTFMKMINYTISQYDEIPYLEVIDCDYAQDKNTNIESTSNIESLIQYLTNDEHNTDKTNILWNYNKDGQQMFSITKYMQYLECPRKYYLKYKARLDSNMLELSDELHADDIIFDFSDFEETKVDIPANVRGSIIHEILKRIVLNKINNKDEMYRIGKNSTRKAFGV